MEHSFRLLASALRAGLRNLGLDIAVTTRIEEPGDRKTARPLKGSLAAAPARHVSANAAARIDVMRQG